MLAGALNLTHYQMTNFRFFHTERVCRRQFQICQKWQKVIQMGRKHCGKRRNCSLRAISPFPTVFSKGLFPRGRQKASLCGNGLINRYTFSTYPKILFISLNTCQCQEIGQEPKHLTMRLISSYSIIYILQKGGERIKPDKETFIIKLFVCRQKGTMQRDSEVP